MELTKKRSLSRWATLSFTCLIMSGCATAGAPSPHGLGAGEWRARLPATPSPIAELAYGTPNAGALPESDALATLDRSLLDRAAEAKATRRSRHLKWSYRSKPIAPTALARAAVLPQAEAKAEAPETPQLSVTADPAPASTLALAQNDAGARYAEREQQAKPQQQFRGGDAIVISAGAIVLVLLIVILILLLR